MRRSMLGVRRLTRGGLSRRGASGLALVVGAVALTLSVGAASGAPGPGVAIDFASTGYKIHRTTELTGWEQPGFDDSGADWATAQAPFGSGTGCGFPTANTPFDSLETIFLRKPFTLPDNAFGLHVAGTIDNVVDLWVNGHGEGHVADGDCHAGTIAVDVPSADLSRGAGNPDGADDAQLIAAKAVGQDAGSPSFFDVKVTYGTIDFTQQPAETLKLSPIAPAPTVTITDAQGQPVSGKTVAVSLTTLDGSGTLTGVVSQPTDGSGVATFSGLAVTSPGRYRLVATSEGASVKSDAFAVDDLKFAQQPTEAQKGSTISPAPTVTIKDPDGTGLPGKTVQLALQTISGSGTLAGTTSATTDGNGVAAFPDLSVSGAGQYTLKATSDNATTTSNAFLIADQVTPCSGSCSAQGTNSGTTYAASTSSSGGSLAVSVIANAGVPAGVCGSGFTPKGAGSYVNLLGSSGNLTITWTLARATIKQLGGSPLALFYDICLGAENLSHPDGSGVTPWRTKFLKPSTPVADPNLGVTLFWGLLPNCLLVPWSHGKPTTPCVIDKRNNLRGDVIIDFFLPAPWDASMHGG